jgi:hypothetical protein
MYCALNYWALPVLLLSIQIIFVFDVKAETLSGESEPQVVQKIKRRATSLMATWYSLIFLYACQPISNPLEVSFTIISL